MSVKLFSYVWDGCVVVGMKILKVVIMVCFVDFFNDEGVCWLFVMMIVWQIGVGESIVCIVLVELEIDGWLSKKVCCVGNCNVSNVYQLNVVKFKVVVYVLEFDILKFDGLKFDGLKFDGLKFDGLEFGNNGIFDLLEFGGDLLVKLILDLLSKNIFG